jgi:hypothetical protein
VKKLELIIVEAETAIGYAKQKHLSSIISQT